MDSKIELRLIGYYSSNSIKLNPETERIEEAQELSPLIQQSLASLNDNDLVDESFIKVLRGNTVFIFKTRENELIAYHTTSRQIRFSNVRYEKRVVTPVLSNYKKWFVPGEKIMVKTLKAPELKIDISDLSQIPDEKWWDKYEVISGTVQHVTYYGAFVDFGNKTGLIHVSNLTWDPIEHPGEILRHGDNINAVIIGVDSDGKVQLGYKQLHKKHSSLKNGDVVVGYVTQVLPNAYLVQINDYKAILPFSESISKNITESDIVVATVIKNEWNTEKFRHDTVVSQRSFHDDFANSHNIGDIVNFKIVKTVNNNGKPSVLVKKGNLYVIIPLKCISKSYRDRLSEGDLIEDPVTFVYTGQNTATRLVSFDMRPIDKAKKEAEQKRIQEEREAAKIAAKNKRHECIEHITSELNPGTIIEVTVANITKNNVLVNITDELTEYIPKEELSTNKVISAEDEVFIGEPISVVYLGKNEDRIILSRKMISESYYSDDLYEKSLDELLLTMGIATNKFVSKVIDTCWLN